MNRPWVCCGVLISSALAGQCLIISVIIWGSSEGSPGSGSSPQVAGTRDLFSLCCSMICAKPRDDIHITSQLLSPWLPIQNKGSVKLQEFVHVPGVQEPGAQVSSRVGGQGGSVRAPGRCSSWQQRPVSVLHILVTSLHLWLMCPFSGTQTICKVTVLTIYA